MYHHYRRRLKQNEMAMGPESRPYQVTLNRVTHEKAMTKAQTNGVKLADVVRMAIEQFVECPIEVTVGRLRKHSRRKH